MPASWATHLAVTTSMWLPTWRKCGEKERECWSGNRAHLLYDHLKNSHNSNTTQKASDLLSEKQIHNGIYEHFLQYKRCLSALQKYKPQEIITCGFSASSTNTAMAKTKMSRYSKNPQSEHHETSTNFYLMKAQRRMMRYRAGCQKHQGHERAAMLTFKQILHTWQSSASKELKESVRTIVTSFAKTGKKVILFLSSTTIRASNKNYTDPKANRSVCSGHQAC